MLDYLRSKLGMHQHWTTWMIVLSILVMALTVQPRLLTYIMVIANGAWMVLTREVARIERPPGEVCSVCLVIAGAVLLGCFLLVLKINWLAI